MAIKEHVIHLVQKDNDGKSLAAINAHTVEKIITLFGGCTVSDCHMGYWKDTESGETFVDVVDRVTVAFDAGGLVHDYDYVTTSAHQFRDLASRYKAQAKQLAVYVVINGEVEFI